ncbi:hypothetical protein B0H11DRAFT_115194 [Mycena galericulata]|nr:hypothetical protein B0H11DRAFT_115194 [Mycena galericulata]
MGSRTQSGQPGCCCYASWPSSSQYPAIGSLPSTGSTSVWCTWAVDQRATPTTSIYPRPLPLPSCPCSWYAICLLISLWYVIFNFLPSVSASYIRPLRIYRLYVIFGHRRAPAIFPLILLVGQAVAGGGVISAFVKFNPTDSEFTFYSWSNGWVSTTLVLTIAISAYSSAMISRKIWWTRRAVGSLNLLSAQVSSGGVQPLSFLAIVVESAALQTAASLALLVTFQLGSYSQALWQQISPAIFGISTVLIHARVGLGWAYAGQHDAGGTPSRISFALNAHAHADADPTKAGRAAVEAY